MYGGDDDKIIIVDCSDPENETLKQGNSCKGARVKISA